MFTSIIAIIFVLSLVIFVHEFGHFIIAKKTKTKVEEFGFGYPPRIFGIKRGGTIYSINWIPFGGFVKIKGEANTEKKKIANDSFLSKKMWQRMVIMSGGIVMNIILAAILFSVAFMIGAPGDAQQADQKANISDVKIQILTVEKDWPAEKAGLQSGDIILSIDGNYFPNIEKLNEYNKNKINQEISIEMKRDNEIMVKKLTLAETTEGEQKRAIMGVSLVELAIIRYPFFQSIWLGFKYCFNFLVLIFVFLFNLIKGLFIGQPVSEAITGPIGVAVLTSKVIKLGFSYLLQFIAIISLNLAAFNLIPFPALDGSKLLFLLIEKIRKKRISLKVENAFHTVGFIILIILSIFIAFKDWQRYF